MPAPRREIGRDRDAALALHRRRDGAADGAGRAGDEHDLVLETGHDARGFAASRNRSSVEPGGPVGRRLGVGGRDRRRLGLAGARVRGAAATAACAAAAASLRW